MNADTAMSYTKRNSITQHHKESVQYPYVSLTLTTSANTDLRASGRQQANLITHPLSEDLCKLARQPKFFLLSADLITFLWWHESDTKPHCGVVQTEATVVPRQLYSRDVTRLLHSLQV